MADLHGQKVTAPAHQGPFSSNHWSEEVRQVSIACALIGELRDTLEDQQIDALR